MLPRQWCPCISWGFYIKLWYGFIHRFLQSVKHNAFILHVSQRKEITLWHVRHQISTLRYDVPTNSFLMISALSEEFPYNMCAKRKKFHITCAPSKNFHKTCVPSKYLLYDICAQWTIMLWRVFTLRMCTQRTFILWKVHPVYIYLMKCAPRYVR